MTLLGDSLSHGFKNRFELRLQNLGRYRRSAAGIAQNPSSEISNPVTCRTLGINESMWMRSRLRSSVPSISKR
jgi:hypothetical protein